MVHRVCSAVGLAQGRAMSQEPWTSPDAPRWKRIVMWGAICAGGAAIWALLLAGPLVRLWGATVWSEAW